MMLGHKILFDHAMAEANRAPTKAVARPASREAYLRRGDEERRSPLAA